MIEGDACPINENVVWQTLCQEARADANSEPALASYLFSTILAHRSLEDALAFVLANKLRSNVLLDSQLLELFSVQYRRDHSLVKKAQADMQAVMDRDPACDKYLQILLFFKGFKPFRRTAWRRLYGGKTENRWRCCFRVAFLRFFMWTSIQAQPSARE